MSQNTSGPILDSTVRAVLSRLHEGRRRPADGGPMASGHLDPHAYAEYGFSIFPEQGELIYLLCRSIRARRVVEFATSIGMSTVYLATAVRDNGGGYVIGSELVPEKIAVAKKNLEQAGLGHGVDIREGDARTTLRDLGGPADFALIDGWPTERPVSLAREVIEVIAPQMRIGGIVMNDNGEHDYLEFIRDPKNGFRSMSLPIKAGTELSVKVD